jgi:hypothetical protein
MKHTYVIDFNKLSEEKDENVRDMLKDFIFKFVEESQLISGGHTTVYSPIVFATLDKYGIVVDEKTFDARRRKDKIDKILE